MAPPSQTISVAAPGKVLLTGGYLITQRGYGGLVVVTDALFVSTVRPTASAVPWNVRISSPQFCWMGHYTVSLDGPNVRLDQIDDGSPPNRYVQIAAVSALSYAYGVSPACASILSHGIEIIVLGHNDFYSQRHSLCADRPSLDMLRRLPHFNRLPHDAMTNLRKTGLGSSAALVTSIVGSVLHFLGAADATTDGGRIAIHNVAQFAHCLAQGRVGSGFDVSSAVFGTQHYERFSPALLEPLLAAASGAPAAAPPTADLVAALMNPWDAVAAPRTLPPGLELVLGDIAAGSNTPSLVGGVNAWRQARPDEANRLWTELDAANHRVEDALQALSALSTSDEVAYKASLARCARLPYSQWDATDAIALHLHEAASAFLDVRRLLRAMGDAAGVPIEPPSQTALVDHCITLNGVVLAGVPGAGGYDAVMCVVIGHEARDNVLAMWREYEHVPICPLMSAAARDSLRIVPTPPEAL